MVGHCPVRLLRAYLELQVLGKNTIHQRLPVCSRSSCYEAVMSDGTKDGQGWMCWFREGARAQKDQLLGQ